MARRRPQHAERPVIWSLGARVQGKAAKISMALMLLVFSLAAKPAGAAEPVKILVLGDSLTAGLGLPASKAFPAQLEAALQQSGSKVRVINAGVSGDTTQGGLNRLSWALSDKPDLVIVELGANDMLRGLDPGQTRKNLDAILRRLKKAKHRVILAGMRAAPNLGPRYVRAFDGLFPQLAKKHDVAIYPFFLEGVALKPMLNQPDGMHPNARGVGVIVKRILPTVKKALLELGD